MFLTVHGILDAPAHVLIDKSIPDSPWFIFSALAAAAAAIATSILAFITRNLAKATSEMATKTAELATQTASQVRESVEAIAQTERHHQESLMPLVSVLGGFKIYPRENANWFAFSGEIINDGPGAAVSVMFFAYNDSVPILNTNLPEIGGRKSKSGLLRPLWREPISPTWEIRPGPPFYNEMRVEAESVVLFKTVFGTEGMVAQFTPTHGAPSTRKVILPSATSRDQISEYFASKGYGEVPDY